MDRYFDDNHLMIRDMVREFARNEIAPVAGELDQTGTFPWENVKKMGELGLLGVPWAEELGGAGMDYISYIIAIHETAKVDAAHAITISAHTTLGTSPIVAFATDPDQERDESPTSIFQNTTVFDLSHQPSISVPSGLDGEGMPTGLMVSGALWDDALVLRVGHAFQQATDWHKLAPAL